VAMYTRTVMRSNADSVYTYHPRNLLPQTRAHAEDAACFISAKGIALLPTARALNACIDAA